jgi:hypothetical protein
MANKPISDNTAGVSGRLMKARINPLRWSAAHDEPPTCLGTRLSHQAALEWLAGTLVQEDLPQIMKMRYHNLEGMDSLLAAIPESQLIVEKVLIPLRQAKAAYVMGHEFSCLALSAMVGEMLATLRFLISDYSTRQEPMTVSTQKLIFGGSFEDLSQSRRISVLRGLKLIDEQTGKDFAELSQIRNKYLHRLTKDHKTMEPDARKCYEIAAKLTAVIFGFSLHGASITLHPDIMRFIYKEEAAESGEPSA